jgi:hypothetical protein
MKKLQKSTTLRALQAGLLASTLLAAPAFGARLAYEGFDYTQADATKLHAITTPGGTGWTGKYGGKTTTATTDASLISPGLTYTGLAPTTGKAMKWQNGHEFYRPWGSGTYAAPVAPANGTYWYSLLFRPLGGRGTICIMGKPTDPQNGFGIRMDNVGGVTPQFKAHGDNASSGTNLDFTNGYNKTYFIVGKIVINSAGAGGLGAHSNTIWVYNDPTALPTVEPTTGGSTMTHDNTKIALFRTALTGRGFSDASVGLSADEVRIGTSFADVFPPASLVLSPTTGVEGQDLTFTWANIPTGVTAMELDPGDIPLTVSASGSTTLPAPAANETYTLTYTVDGIDSTLTQNFTVIPPSFTLSPLTGFPGDTLTLNWFVPLGATDVTLTPTPGTAVALTGTSLTTGAGSTTLIAPSVTTGYAVSYTLNSSTFTLPTQTFTPNASIMSVTPELAVDTRPLTITWRILPEWNDNALPEDNVVRLQSSPSGDFVNDLSDDVVVTTNTNGTTGAGSYNTNVEELLPFLPARLGVSQYRVVYKVAGVETVASDTITSVEPLILQDITATNNTKPVAVNSGLLNDGVSAYSDRGHVWANIPSILQGAQFVRFGQDDKVTPNLTVSFRAGEDATFFLLIDNRTGPDTNGINNNAPPELGGGVMDWVLTSGFVDSGVDIGLDEGANGSVDQTYSVYFRQVSGPGTEFPIGEEFTFFELNNGGQRNMYGVAAVSPQIVPVAFVATPTAFTKDSISGSTLQWTVPVGATASIANNVGTNIGVVSVDSVTGTGSIQVFPEATTTYTLTYDPAGAAPPVILAPVTVNVNTFTVTPDTIDEGQSTTLAWQLPPGATAVTINGVVIVPEDTNANGAGSKIITPTGSGNYSLSYTAAGATAPTPVGSVFVTVNPNLSFAGWIDNNFSGNTVPTGLRGPNDDPDNDGLSNLMEYAISNGDPTRSMGSPATFGEGNLVIFYKNPEAIGVTYLLEKSGTLANDWVPATPLTTEDAFEISYTLAPPTPSKEFIRLKVTQD